MLSGMLSTPKFSGLILENYGREHVSVNVEKKGEGGRGIGSGECFGVPSSPLEDDQVILTCPTLPDAFYRGKVRPYPDGIKPYKGFYEGTAAPPASPGMAYAWQYDNEPGITDYTFRHPKVKEFVDWLRSPGGQRASIEDVRKQLHNVINDAVLVGLSKDEKQSNPFVKAFSPDGANPARPPERPRSLIHELLPAKYRKFKTPGKIFAEEGRLSFSNSRLIV